ncbi:MAG: YbaB/EbfC family nucleoid-associated protein [Rhizobiales bacterium]|nr:YbaB/EbfC family nucleoid-associated protein [Hyphomicrobiales bacterium]
MKGFTGMLKQAQEMQARMEAVQSELEQIEITGQAGAGMVKVTLSGKGDMKGVEIDPSIFKPEDAEIVEDLILTAHNDAKSKLEVAVSEKMKDVTGGLQLPPGLIPGM